MWVGVVQACLAGWWHMSCHGRPNGSSRAAGGRVVATLPLQRTCPVWWLPRAATTGRQNYIRQRHCSAAQRQCSAAQRHCNAGRGPSLARQAARARAAPGAHLPSGAGARQGLTGGLEDLEQRHTAAAAAPGSSCSWLQWLQRISCAWLQRISGMRPCGCQGRSSALQARAATGCPCPSTLCAGL